MGPGDAFRWKFAELCVIERSRGTGALGVALSASYANHGWPAEEG